LKAGGVYVPLDISYPDERLLYLVKDAGAGIVICLPEQKVLFDKDIQSAVISVGDERTVRSMPGSRLPLHSRPDSLAYIMYTSGSTGAPKGVMVEHRNVVSLVKNSGIMAFDNEVLLSTGSPSFDATTFEFWGTLLNGSTLVLCPESVLLDTELLKTEIRKQKITAMWFTAGWFNQLADADADVFKGLKTIIAGGDRLSKEHIEKTKKAYPRVVIINGYGPTENTTFSLTYPVEKINHSNIPIGRPLNNRTAYILNQYGKLCPVGAAGEIYVGGSGVSRGYLNRPELNEARFVGDTFSKRPGAKLYRTGDTGRWLPQGIIEFLGRKDEQVKIRGYRVELEEIENVLMQLPFIASCAVVVKENNSLGKYLVAYYVLDGLKESLNIATYLKNKLPDYMTPSQYVELGLLPLTANGKTDRRALQQMTDPDIQTDAGGYEAPASSAEQQLVEIWKPLLGKERISIRDNFFALGGHSLLVMRMVAAIRKNFSVKISVKEIFSRPTIRELAVFISEQKKISSASGIQQRSSNQRIPLSFSQERLRFIDQLEGSKNYIIPIVLKMNGRPDRDALEYSFRETINRHEVLRTVIKEDEEGWCQHILDTHGWQLKYAALPAGPEDIHTFTEQYISLPFDIHRDYMLRASLVEHSPTEHTLVIVMHHIATDGWSMSVMMRELIELYVARLEKRPPVLKKLAIQYADYSIWQHSIAASNYLQEQLTCWENKLKGYHTLQLSTDFPRPAIHSTRGAGMDYFIGKPLVNQLYEFSRRQESTLFMVLLAAFKTLLFRYTGEEDILVGSPAANRTMHETDPLIGCFVNTLVLRSQVNAGMAFEELVQSVKKTTLEAYDLQDVPFEKIVEKVVVDRDMSRTPLFQVMFVLQNIPELPEQNEGGINWSLSPVKSLTSKFDLCFTVTERTDGLAISVEYCTDLFKKETIAQIAGHYQQLLSSIVSNPAFKVGELAIMSAEEEKLLLQQSTGTKKIFPSGETIADMFEAQTLQTPGSPAVTFGNTTLTYEQLNTKANQLAGLINKNYKTGTGTKIGLCMERSPEMVIAILGILKAGAAYVPIDPAYPQERKNFMLEDSGAVLLITDKAILPRESVIQEWIWQADELEIYETKNSKADISPSGICYIIYTSGSTGTPKGVLVQHSNVVNLLYACREYIITGYNDRWTLFHSVCFDFSVWEIFGCLCSGGELLVVSMDMAKNSQEFAGFISREKVTVLNQVPTMFSNLTEYMLGRGSGQKMALRYVIFGGEALHPGMLRNWQQKYPDVKLINMYGITETTVHVTYKEITTNEINEGISNVGVPLANVELYIMNGCHQLQPYGALGEITVGGAGVTAGYLNRKELNETRFIENPYRPGEKLYCSGDLGVMNAAGEILYKHRMDNQVKIRGYRIELGEIERRLLEHEEISEAAVINQPAADGSGQLIAYIVSKGEITVAALREFLAARLPEYMIPSQFTALPFMPVTANGKIDRAALPASEMKALPYAAVLAMPVNKTEEQLLRIWQEVLGKETISTTDNFFEIGGHSLKATQMVSRIHKEMEVSVELRLVFSHPTIEKLAAVISPASTDTYSQIEPVPAAEHYALSHAQRRLWILNQLDEDRTAYNMYGTYLLKGKLDTVLLQQVFSTVVKRHEILRTNFIVIDGEPRQQVHPAESFLIRMDCVKLQQGNDTGDQLNRLIREEVLRQFDLQTDPLFRSKLLSVSEEEHVLIISMHHIVSDGWTVKVLVNEIQQTYEALYAGKENPFLPLRIQYRDYAGWQNQQLTGEKNNLSRIYWHSQFSDEIPVLDLPLDYKRPANRNYKGDMVSFLLENDVADNITNLAQKEGCSLYMALLASIVSLLYRYTDQEDIVIGCPVAGREHKDLEDQAGFYVNMLALRNRFNGNDGFTKLLNGIRENVLNAYSHQSYPFDSLISELPVYRDLSRSPLFDVAVLLQNKIDNAAINSGNSIQIEKFESKTGHVCLYDLVFDFAETADGIAVSVLYNTDLFARHRIERMAKHYVQLMQSIIKNPSASLYALEILEKQEKEMLLKAFNETDSDYPADKTIIEIFEEQVTISPEAIAVVCNKGAGLTYRELNERANQLAHYLRDKFMVQRDDRIGLVMDRSDWLLIGMLAIVKSGASYLPVDKSYPAERISYMLRDSSVRTVLVDELPVKKSLDDFNPVWVHEGATEMNSCSTSNPAPVNSPSDLAYVIYTSGSTGRAKGVMVEHRSLINLCNWHKNTFGVSAVSRATMYAGISFDASVWEIWPYLLNGACLFPVSNEMRLDIDLLLNFLKKQLITHCFLPTVVCEQITTVPDELSNSLLILTGGDKLKKIHPVLNVVNNYGPTENTVVATSGNTEHSTDKDLIPVGKPVDNTRIYILNQHQQLQPVGVTGEIYIAGAGLARGYLNQDKLTAEKFIPAVYTAGRMYRTGDLGRWLPDGQIEFMGRRDNQLKISGYRVEPGEIESLLLEYDGITGAVVQAEKSEDGSARLIACVTGKPSLNADELRGSLMRQLPVYMMPHHIYYMEAFPVTVNGKLDYKALKAFETSDAALSDVYYAPENDTEEQITALWKQVLQVDQVSVNANFFEAGGNSLKLISMHKGLTALFGNTISIPELFVLNTIRLLAAHFTKDTISSLAAGIEV
jgi:amino acid adenylation domain-containing protein